MLDTKNRKKIEIHLSFPLTQPQHPWDMMAEKAKAKQQKQQHASTKRSVKKQVTFEEDPSSQPNQIFITHQQLAPEPEKEDTTEQDFNELEGPDEGIFLCPECTCWFTNKKDLNFHKRHWCGR